MGFEGGSAHWAPLFLCLSLVPALIKRTVPSGPPTRQSETGKEQSRNAGRRLKRTETYVLGSGPVPCVGILRHRAAAAADARQTTDNTHSSGVTRDGVRIHTHFGGRESVPSRRPTYAADVSPIHPSRVPPSRLISSHLISLPVSPSARHQHSAATATNATSTLRVAQTWGRACCSAVRINRAPEKKFARAAARQSPCLSPCLLSPSPAAAYGPHA